jgi:FkbM family methyltransferase
MMTVMERVYLNNTYPLLIPDFRADTWNRPVGWEKPRVDSMHEHIGKGDVVYYVGAELGEMSALCASWGAKVVNFEPNFSSWPTIKAIFDANKLKPLANYAGFASNVHQPIPPHADGSIFRGNGYCIMDDGWPEYAHADVREEHFFSELYQEADGLPQYKIDLLIIEQGLTPPTVITFDCEGSEWEAMKGAEATIRKYKPKIWGSISPEFMFHQWNQYSRDFRNWLIDLGYTETIIDYQHELHTLYLPNGKQPK